VPWSNFIYGLGYGTDISGLDTIPANPSVALLSTLRQDLGLGFRV